jgi:hypothetical protein
MECRSRSKARLLVAATAGAGLVLSFAIAPERASGGPVVCPFRLVTGLPCPGCGLGHAFVAISHGDFAAAFAHHPFGLVAYAASVVVVLVVACELLARRTLVGRSTLARLRAPGVVLVASWLGWAALRLVTG